MKIDSAFLQRVSPEACQKSNFTVAVQIVSAEALCLHGEAQYPGYECASTHVRGA